MPRPLLIAFFLALGAVTAVVLVSCGSDDEDGVIPPESASAMLATLQDAEGATDCDAIEEAASAVANEAAGLPESEARTGVIDGAENLATLARNGEGCETGTTSPEGPEDDTTTTTTAPPTDTTTDEETTTTTTEEEEKPKPKPKPTPEPEPEPEPPGQGQPPGPPETGGTGSGSIGEDDNGD